MYRPETKGAFFLIFFLPMFFLACCSNAQVLGISKTEASSLLEKGDLGFINSAELPADFLQAVSVLKQLALVHPAAPFYSGLAAKTEIKTLLFCAALESASSPARQEAAKKLIAVVLKTENNAQKILDFLDSAKPRSETPALRAACLYRTGLYSEAAALLSGADDGEWEKALSLFAEWKSSPGIAESQRQKIPDFLFQDASDEILSWAHGEALSSNGLFSSGELAALSAKLLPGNYRAMLEKLKDALADSQTIFFRYPELMTLLGRAYQYTPAMREEGASLFSAWNRLLEGEAVPVDKAELGNFIKTLKPENLSALKFITLFYSGRIERARENYSASSEYFNRARSFAPDALQSDTCIWYTLMNALAKDPSGAVPVILATIHNWNDVSYFDDIMDRLSSYLLGRRQWGQLLELFYLLEGHEKRGASYAQYAWILGRAAEEGFLKTEGINDVPAAENFFRSAFEAEKTSYYHRTMAALKLGAVSAPDDTRFYSDGIKIKKMLTIRTRAEEDETAFILGFFECGAASLALPYLKTREEKLSGAALSEIAKAFADSGRWKDSLELVSRYSGRKDYVLSNRDLFLFYPQPYRELIEKYAKEAGLRPELLYSVIRTESYFMSGIVSRSGATGLAQVMDSTAAEMALRISRRGGSNYRRSEGVDLKDPEINIHIGSYYLSYLMEQTGNPMQAIMAYNGGPGRIRRALAADKKQSGLSGEAELPTDLFLEAMEIHETREYGRRVLATAAVYGYLYYGKTMEEVAADIYRLTSKKAITKLKMH